MILSRMKDRRKEVQKVAHGHMKILIFEAGLTGEDERTMLSLKTADKLQILVRNFRILGNSDLT